ncbi:MAG: hypothetical protein K2Y21_00565 [Phycisphaerales bacterium]|nr:hypothetical protein [Phycisphaerales bacterium]
MKLTVAASAAILVSSAAQAAWGLQYDLSKDGVTWASTVNASSGDTISFRIGAYFDVGTKITTADGTGNAMAVGRFTGSSRFTSFLPGDVLQNVVRTASSGEVPVVQTSGGVIGTSSVTSFAGQVLATLPAQPQTYYELLRGELKVHSGVARFLDLINKTFGSGSVPGLVFYHDGSPLNLQSGVPDTPRFDRTAYIFIPSPPSLTMVLGVAFAARRRRR